MFHNNNKRRGFFLAGTGLAGAVLSLLFSVCIHAQDNDGFVLQTNTDRCIALRQGQTCYKRVELQWRAPRAGNYCVVDQQAGTVVQCWQQQSGSTVTIDFASNRDIDYALRRENSDSNLASTTVKISWVYEPKPEKSGGWRLF